MTTGARSSPDDAVPTAGGPTVVLPRGGEWADRVTTAARARGLVPVVVPLIDDAEPADAGPLDTALRHLSDHAWLVVTSATAVRVVAGRVPRLPSGLRVAAVGDRTAAAARQAGWRVDLVPDDASAAGLVAAFPDVDGQVLFARSEIAAPTLADGLRARGTIVEEVVAYRTVATGDERIALSPAPAAVLVTSGSVARQVAHRLAPIDPRTLIACIGPGTASDARATGLPVHLVAAERSAESLLDAVADALGTPTDHQNGDPS